MVRGRTKDVSRVEKKEETRATKIQRNGNDLRGSIVVYNVDGCSSIDFGRCKISLSAWRKGG